MIVVVVKKGFLELSRGKAALIYILLNYAADIFVNRSSDDLSTPGSTFITGLVVFPRFQIYFKL